MNTYRIIPNLSYRYKFQCNIIENATNTNTYIRPQQFTRAGEQVKRRSTGTGLSIGKFYGRLKFCKG